MARQFLQIVTESAYRVPTATPALNVDRIPIRISDGNAFALRPAPQFWTIRSADSRNRRALTGSERTVLAGRLQTRLYYEQAPLLLKWALQPILAGGPPAVPWATAEPVGDLASCTVYHAIERDDGTLRRRAYEGCKVGGGELAGDNGTDLLTLSLDLVASTPRGDPTAATPTADPDATEFPEPASADYPVRACVFQDSAGALKIGDIRSNYSSFRLTWRSNLDPRHDEFRYITSARHNGRDVDFNANLLLKATPDDRTTLETVSPLDCSVTFTDGTYSFTFDFNGFNYVTADADATPLERRFDHTLSLSNYLDPASTDMTLSFAGYT